MTVKSICIEGDCPALRTQCFLILLFPAAAANLSPTLPPLPGPSHLRRLSLAQRLFTVHDLLVELYQYHRPLGVLVRPDRMSGNSGWLLMSVAAD